MQIDADVFLDLIDIVQNEPAKAVAGNAPGASPDTQRVDARDAVCGEYSAFTQPMNIHERFFYRSGCG